MVAVYPRWSFFPRNATPPAWVAKVINAVAAVESVISTERELTGPDDAALDSDAVLKATAPGLEALGFVVEKGKKDHEKVKRPVLYGENGVPAIQYEIDGFHDEWGVALEVEAGRGIANNNDYRNITRTSLILDARFLAMLMPITYRAAGTKSYETTRQRLDAIYTSDRLKLPFDGVLLIGY